MAPFVAIFIVAVLLAILMLRVRRR